MFSDLLRSCWWVDGCKTLDGKVNSWIPCSSASFQVHLLPKNMRTVCVYNHRRNTFHIHHEKHGEWPYFSNIHVRWIPRFGNPQSNCVSPQKKKKTFSSFLENWKVSKRAKFYGENQKNMPSYPSYSSFKIKVLASMSIKYPLKCCRCHVFTVLLSAFILMMGIVNKPLYFWVHHEKPSLQDWPLESFIL